MLIKKRASQVFLILVIPIFLLSCSGKNEHKSPLINAIMEGDLYAVKSMTDRGMNVNEKDASKLTPLIYAVMNEKSEIVEILIEKGANIEDKDKDGDTALMYSIAQGNDFLTYLLVEKGANVNVKNKKGETPLMLAVRSGRIESVKVLVKAGANTKNQKNWKKETQNSAEIQRDITQSKGKIEELDEIFSTDQMEKKLATGNFWAKEKKEKSKKK